MSKTVKETEFKIFRTYLDAVYDSNYVLESVDVEGGSPPDQIWSKEISSFCLIKNFTRWNGQDNFIEKIYIKFG